jgi:AraC-like DNA-binding protein
MRNYHRYLIKGDIEEKWGFWVNTVGYSKTKPHHLYPADAGHPADHAFNWNNGRIVNGWYVVFITKGKGVLETSATGKLELTEGTCFFLFPGVWHRYQPDRHTGWEEYWIGFQGAYPAALMKQSFFSAEQPAILVGTHLGVLQLFHQIMEVSKEAREGYNQVLSGLVLQMLALLFFHRLQHDETGELIPRVISSACFLLQESVDQPVSMEAVARELAMSYSSFRKLFKQHTGVSPNQYLLALRLQKAKELLQTTSLSVQEISVQTGFETIHYFSKHFKQKHGMSPSNFRSAGAGKGFTFLILFALSTSLLV